VRKFMHKWKTFMIFANLPKSGCPSKFIPWSDFAITPGNYKKPKSYISNSAGLG